MSNKAPEVRLKTVTFRFSENMSNKAPEVRLKTVTFRVSENQPVLPKASGAEQAVEILRMILSDLDQDREHFILLALDVKNNIRGYKVCHTGGTASSIVDRANVFRDALLLGAKSIVVAHNHPSGDPEPSPEDLATSAALRDGATTIGLRLLDSIVIGDAGRWSSLHNRGLLNV